MTNLEYCNEILSIIGNVTEANDAIYNLAFDAYLKLGGQESQPSLATIYNELKNAIQIWDNTDSLNITKNGTYNLLGKIITVNVQCSGSIPANNEIWYTSSDGNIITPKESSLPTIVSNTYVDGKGVIKFASDVTSIGNLAFSNRGLTTITIPNSVTSIESLAFFNCTSLTSVTIPNSVTSIGEFAFNRCSGLTSVTIPNSVTSIGDNAFTSCTSLTSVTIPNSVTSIGYSPFVFCENLTSIIIESGNTVYDSRNNCNAIILTDINMIVSGCQNTIIPDGVNEIGRSSFAGCTGLTSIEIPVSVLYISDLAFAGCTGLTSIEIPVSVLSISDYAFRNCTGLTSISYTGTIAQYNAISKGYSWNYNVPATVVHCTDGDAPLPTYS